MQVRVLDCRNGPEVQAGRLKGSLHLHGVAPAAVPVCVASVCVCCVCVLCMCAVYVCCVCVVCGRIREWVSERVS